MRDGKEATNQGPAKPSPEWEFAWAAKIFKSEPSITEFEHRLRRRAESSTRRLSPRHPGAE